MNTALRLKIFMMVVASIALPVGATLAGATTFAAFGFLTSGYPMSQGVLGIIWGVGLAVYVGGIATTHNHLGFFSVACAVVGFFVSGLGTIFVVNPIYWTIFVPSIICVILLTTFVEVVYNFAIETAKQEETKI